MTRILSSNLVPRVFKLFGQRGNAGKTLGTSKKFNFFDWLFRNGFHCFTAEILPISYPESSGFLVSGATPGRLWGHRKNSIFLIGCSVTVSIVLPQKSCGNKIRCPQSLPGVAPLTKKPEDSGYEIACHPKTLYPRVSRFPAPLDKGNEGSGNEIGFPMGDSYLYRNIFAQFKTIRRKQNLANAFGISKENWG